MKGTPCECYLSDIMRGLHRPDDTYKLALYKGATPSARTERYSAAHEVPASGSYQPGGGVLTGFWSEGGCLHFDDLTFTKATIVKPTCALVYNASRGDRALAWIAFDELVESFLGKFLVQVPVPLLEIRCGA